MKRFRMWKTIFCFLTTLSWLVLFLSANSNAAQWWEQKVPSIEELTKGKVKIGDMIDKNNVDLIKEFIPNCMLVMIQDGMVLRMAAPPLPLNQRVPQYFLDYTEKNMGQATVDRGGSVRLKDGKNWPGGIAFIKPKDALEVMGNAKFCKPYDDLILTNFNYNFIDKEGKLYKTAIREMKNLNITCRMQLPPIGSFPGMENIRNKRISYQTYPIEAKGLGMVDTRFYDDATASDLGFLYLPAFKRVIRVSASTWQDSVAGGDWTFGDSDGLYEPYTNWNFKYLGRKYMLEAEERPPEPYLDQQGKDLHTLKYTKGKKYPLVGWRPIPVDIVECTPTIRHIYSKKVLYCRAPEVWVAEQFYPYVEMFDKSGKLWKDLTNFGGFVYSPRPNENYACNAVVTVYDLQTGHSTACVNGEAFQTGQKPDEFTVKALYATAR